MPYQKSRFVECHPLDVAQRSAFLAVPNAPAYILLHNAKLSACFVCFMFAHIIQPMLVDLQMAGLMLLG